MRPNRFLFEQDFRAPRPAAVDAHVAAGTAEREMAEQLAYARGVDEGRRQAQAETGRQLAEAAERLAAQVAAGIAGEARLAAEVEQQGLRFFAALSRKLAGDALAQQPLGPITELASDAFRHLRGVPHVVIRVSPGLVEDADALMGRLARERGFEGRTVVLGDEQLAPGDARIEWADGGLVRNGAELDEAVARILAAALDDGQDKVGRP